MPWQHVGVLKLKALVESWCNFAQFLLTKAIDAAWGVHSIEEWTQPASWTKNGGTKIMHIFMKVGERKIKGKERLSYLSTYLHYYRA